MSNYEKNFDHKFLFQSFGEGESVCSLYGVQVAISNTVRMSSMKVFKMISDIKIGNIFLPNTNVVILISQMLSVACKIKCCQSAIGSSHILKTSVWRPKNNKSSKLISRQVYCSRLCGSWLISCNKQCLIISNNTLKLNYKVFE